MTIKECIDAVDTLKPNEYSITDKVRWLSFVDEKIINDVLKTHEGYDNAYDEFKGYSDDALTVTLIAPSPYDRLYPAFIVMQIDYENGDTQKYQNSNITFNSYLMEYKRYYNKTHKPLLELGECKPRPVKPINKLSPAEIEAITRDLEYYISDEVENATSDDVIYDIVMKYVNNNAQMLKGKDGKQGKDGLTPYIAENGNWWIGLDDTGVKAKGQDGKVSFNDLTPEQKESLKGEDGKDGKDGKDGISPDMSNYYTKTETETQIQNATTPFATNIALGLAKDELQEQIKEVSESLDDYVKFSDVAVEEGSPGLVKLDDNASGLTIDKNGNLCIYRARDGHITAKKETQRPLTPSGIDLAVKVGLTTNTIDLTASEKNTAADWLGALKGRLVTAEYDGTGTTNNWAEGNTITFEGKPLLVIISDISQNIAANVGSCVLLYGQRSAITLPFRTEDNEAFVDWTNNSVRLYNQGTVATQIHLNAQGQRYRYVAILENA